ncbi:MAG: IPT/TIG domain-containing protein [Candidatus Dormiibacterota bacterium]
MGKIGASSGATTSARSSAPLVSTQTDTLVAPFSGASQEQDIAAHGSDQDVAPPDTDVGVGPSYVVATVNSTINVYTRAGALAGTDDLNAFLSIGGVLSSTDPRIVYDAASARWWLTDTEEQTFSCSSSPAPVLIAVSASSNPLPFSSWIVYTLPFDPHVNAFLGDQPGLGISTNVAAVTWNDYDCNGNFLGAEVDILQKSDLEHNTGTSGDAPFFGSGLFAPQPVQSFGTTTTQYVVTNLSDCAFFCTTTPSIEVDAFKGTPEGKDVTVVSSNPDMSPTAVDPVYFNTPPAQQQGTSTTIQTDDDRFLNAVWENGHIWTADNTDCIPTSDTVARSCLNYVDVTASSTGVVNLTINQINNVGVNGSYLYYPAVSLDSAGNVITVFDESSSSMFPTIVSSSIPSGGSALSAFQTVHTSSGFYNPDFACASINSTNACRWGDYSGAAQDPSNPKDVWVVSEAEDGQTSASCSPASQCWGSDITDLTLAPPIITALNPSLGPLTGGQTVTVTGLDFGTDTTATLGGTLLTNFHVVGPTVFTFVTPAGSAGIDQVQLTDSLGMTLTLPYTYIGLANYTPLSPYRILDTRNTGSGGPLGPGAIRALQVTGSASTQIPPGATAAVLNVTEVYGSASSLLTVFPYGTSKPNASNLNFAAHTVIANLVTVTLGAHLGQGWIDIYNALGTVNVVVDVEGYFGTPSPSNSPAGLFHPMPPTRVCDTRAQSPTPYCRSHGALGQAASMMINFATTGGVPSDGTAAAVVVNLTAVAGTSYTALSLFPPVNGHCPYGVGTSTPPFSTVNLNAGAVQANRAMVSLGPGTPGSPNDAICVYNGLGTINVVIDVNGWYGSLSATAPGYQFQALPPTRICDTRLSTTSCLPLGPIGSNQNHKIPVAGDQDIPAFGGVPTVVAVIANLTAIAPTAKTVLILYPANLPPPNASDVNVEAGEVLPNLVVVQLDTTAPPYNGEVALYNGAGSVNAVIDIEGWFQ